MELIGVSATEKYEPSKTEIALVQSPKIEFGCRASIVFICPRTKDLLAQLKVTNFFPKKIDLDLVSRMRSIPIPTSNIKLDRFSITGIHNSSRSL